MFHGHLSARCLTVLSTGVRLAALAGNNHAMQR